jgi:lipopolysaccharide export system permease protein
MAAENEITALRASGVDLRRVALPLIVTAALIAGGMIWFNDRVLPAANYRWRMLMIDVAQTRSLLFLEPQTINSIPGSTGGPAYYLEAQEIDGETGFMRDVTIYDVSSPQTTRTINADSGRIAFNSQQTDLLLTLFDGTMREVDFHDQASFQTIAFQRQVMRMEEVSGQLERTADSGFRTDRDMTLGMMRTRIDSLRVELNALRETEDSARAVVDARQAALAAGTADSVAPRAGAAVDQLGELPESLFTAAASADHGGGVPPRAPGTADEPEQTTGSPSLEQNGDRPLTESERYIQARARNIDYQIREFQVEMQKKFAIAARRSCSC